jgi:hypothetical protein
MEQQTALVFMEGIVVLLILAEAVINSSMPAYVEDNNPIKINAYLLLGMLLPMMANYS